MAPAGGTDNPDVIEQGPPDAAARAAAEALAQVKYDLESEPCSFDFFQAVRLFSRIFPDRRPPGEGRGMGRLDQSTALIHELSVFFVEL